MTSLDELEARIDALENKVNGDGRRYVLSHLLRQLGEEMEQLREIVNTLQEQLKNLINRIGQNGQQEEKAP